MITIAVDCFVKGSKMLLSLLLTTCRHSRSSTSRTRLYYAFRGWHLKSSATLRRKFGDRLSTVPVGKQLLSAALLPCSRAVVVGCQVRCLDGKRSQEQDTRTGHGETGMMCGCPQSPRLLHVYRRALVCTLLFHMKFSVQTALTLYSTL